MYKSKCNIDKVDRSNRIIIGIILCLAAIFNMPNAFFILAGIILIVEGVIGWCSIPILIEKLQKILYKFR